MACPIDFVVTGYGFPTGIVSLTMPVCYLTIVQTSDAPQCLPVLTTVPATASNTALIGTQ